MLIRENVDCVDSGVEPFAGFEFLTVNVHAIESGAHGEGLRGSHEHRAATANGYLMLLILVAGIVSLLRL